MTNLYGKGKYKFVILFAVSTLFSSELINYIYSGFIDVRLRTLFRPFCIFANKATSVLINVHSLAGSNWSWDAERGPIQTEIIVHLEKLQNDNR